MQFLISIVITILIVGVVAGALVYLVRIAPLIPQPIKDIIIWIIIVVAVLYLLSILVGMGSPVSLPAFHSMRR